MRGFPSLSQPETTVEFPTGKVKTASGEQLGLGLQVYKSAAFNDLEHDRQFVVLFNSLTIDDQVGTAEAARIGTELTEAAACS